MAALTEFEIKLARSIETGGGLKGAGITVDEMMSTLELESTPENLKKVSEALRKLKSQWFVHEILAVSPYMPDEYNVTTKWMEQSSGQWMGPKFGKGITRAND